MYGYNAGPPLAIPIYTVLPYCVMITQYGSAVYIGMAQHYSVLKEILMITFNL